MTDELDFSQKTCKCYGMAWVMQAGNCGYVGKASVRYALARFRKKNIAIGRRGWRIRMVRHLKAWDQTPTMRGPDSDVTSDCTGECTYFTGIRIVLTLRGYW